jgi:hypothetical protein
MRPISRPNQLRNIPDRSIFDLGPHRAQRGRNWLASSKRQPRLSAKAQEAVSRTSDQDTSALECATRGYPPERSSVAPVAVREAARCAVPVTTRLNTRVICGQCGTGSPGFSDQDAAIAIG